MSGQTKQKNWGGWILSGLAIAFLAMDAGMKLLGAEQGRAATEALGWSFDKAFMLGVIQLVCLVLYVVPRTSVLGAILWTGYLGGAVATHVRIDNPLFTHILFPVYVGAFLWLGLWLREPQLRALVPLRND